MRIGVCVKKVPDTETRVKIAADGACVSMDGVSFITSPYDEYAIEEALQIKEKAGQGEVVLITIGDDETQKILRNGLALGADRAIQVKDSAVKETEPYDIARVLAAVIRAENIELALFGKQGVGQDFQQVPAMVAEILGWPAVLVVVALTINDGKLTAHRETDGGEEVLECSLPAVVSAQKGLNTPRYASLKGIMAAKKKAIDGRTLAQLGLEPLPATSWKVERVELPPARPAGKLIEGEPEDQARELVKLLHTEAKVI